MFDIGQLKRIRVRLGMTQTELAKACSLSQSLIAKIEAGQLDPKYSTVRKLEETLARMERAEAPSVRSVLQRRVVTARLDERLPHLIKRMQSAGISQVPVLDAKRIVGLVTEKALLAALADGKELQRLRAADLMEEAPPILPATTPVSVAAQVLEHAPLIVVVDKGALAGVVTRSDLLRKAF